MYVARDETTFYLVKCSQLLKLHWKLHIWKINNIQWTFLAEVKS